MNPQTILEAAKLAAPAAAALLGAWVGAKVSLRRFKDERTFEKKHEWHVKIIHASQRAWQRSAEVAIVLDRGHNVLTEQLAQNAALDELTGLLAEGILYLDGKRWTQLQRAADQFTEASNGVADAIAHGSSRDEVASLVRRELPIIKRMGEIVSEDGRAHFGLSRIG